MLDVLVFFGPVVDKHYWLILVVLLAYCGGFCVFLALSIDFCYDFVSTTAGKKYLHSTQKMPPQ